MTDKEKARAYDKFLREAVEGRIVDDGGEIHLVVPALPAPTQSHPVTSSSCSRAL